MACAGADWHLVFCLPYNNDLAEHSAFIQAELGRLHTDYWDLRIWMNFHVDVLTPDQRVPWRAVFAQGVDTWVRPGSTRPVSELCGVVVARRTPADQDFALATRAPLLWSILP